MTESVVLPPDPSGEPYGRFFVLSRQAEQAIRLAKDSTDPVLQKSLTVLALEYFSQAVAIEALPLGEDPEER